MTHQENGLRRIIRQYPLVAFFGLTYALSWLLWLPMLLAGQSSAVWLHLGTFGPTLAALLVSGVLGGRAAIARLLRGLLIWRVPGFWYAFSFLSTALVVLPAIAAHVWLGGAVPAFNDPAQWYMALLVFGYVLVFSVLGEEIGWRGYALPRLQGRFSALGASMILGLLWALWHLPLFFVAGDVHQGLPLSLFIAQDVGLAILMTWMFNNTRGSLLLAHLFHAASNTTLGLFPIMPGDNAGSVRPLWIAVGLLVLVTMAVVLRAGPEHLSRQQQRITWQDPA
ncbi:MAG: CPBP family intramembrane metalloprotease [Anaerolineae bacterium]|nr:CPBP family intramembrane metalloprotease [Anaerolineae bacterium]